MEFREQVERAVLEACRANRDTRMGRGAHGLKQEVDKRLPTPLQTNPQLLMEIAWSLVARQLAYIDYSQQAVENWSLRLTARGTEVLASEEVRPEVSGQYVAVLRKRIPDVTDTVVLYVDQAMRAYNAGAYVGSAVLIGVAAEAAFIELASVFVEWLPEASARKFRTVLANSANMVKKFDEFRKRLEGHKAQIPSSLTQQSDLRLSGVLNLLREDRNDAGHPTGRRFGREDALEQVQLFMRLAPRMADLRRWFQSELDEGRHGVPNSTP